MIFIFILALVSVVVSGPATESFKGQYCTDPRTMRKHAAYTEWADAYSCTRHRCQPGGRNLAIYTVGCKRVEAPESAIECEEVVEDTNMQFPYCCTRLRCLVVVRGEVWTRVLGQPWEALPAAPWSHMYKMKRPPPTDGSFLPKTPEAGPVYELADTEAHEKVLRASKTTEAPDCNEAQPRSMPAPDIVIALSTNSEKEDSKKGENVRQVPRYLALSEGDVPKHKRLRKTTPSNIPYDEVEHEADAALDMDDINTEKSLKNRGELSSDERFFANPYGVTPKALKGHHQVSWTEIPQSQWNENEPGMETDSNRADFGPVTELPPSNLQALVDAIGTRMRDIETVVQRMSDKVHDAASPQEGSAEQLLIPDGERSKRHKSDTKEHGPAKKQSTESENYKRFSVRNRSKYLHTSESTTELPLFAEDTNMNGYFSDASNSVLRRANGPKEPTLTYMAPVESRRKHKSDVPEDAEKKHKKHSHKKRKGKHGHKKHHGKEEKKKKFNRVSSIEVEKNVVSLEDSGAVEQQS